MATTRSTMLSLVRDRLDETTEHIFGQDSLRRWINEGMRNVARRLELLEVSTDITSVADQESYALPNDLLRINRVEYFENATDYVYTLEYRAFNEMDTVGWNMHQQTSSWHPFAFTVWGYNPAANLIVFPKPDINGATIRVYYYKISTELADGPGADATNIDFPDTWKDLVISYVEWHALRSKRDPRWQEAKMEYEEGILAAQEKVMSHSNQPTRIVFAQNNDGWWW